MKTKQENVQVTSVEVNNIRTKVSSEVILPLTKGVVCDSEGKESKTEAYVLFDSGSQRSFVSKDLVKRLQLKVSGNEELMLHTFAAKRPQRCYLPEAEIDAQLKKGQYERLSLSVIKEMTALLKMRYKNNFGMTVHRKGIKPDILIGVDYYWNFTELGLRKTSEGLYVIPTTLGEVLSGKGDTGGEREKNEDNVLSCYMGTESFEKFWDLESLGIKDMPVSNDDDETLRQFYHTFEFKEKRYVVSWPYKITDIQVADDYSLCFSRLQHVILRLRKEGFLDKYDEVIKNQVPKNITEEVSNEESDYEVSYLPHQPLVTRNKNTTKVRIVYDTSANSRKNM